MKYRMRAKVEFADYYLDRCSRALGVKCLGGEDNSSLEFEADDDLRACEIVDRFLYKFESMGRIHVELETPTGTLDALGKEEWRIVREFNSARSCSPGDCGCKTK